VGQAAGEDLYEIRNSPVYAYGLNFLDLVRAIERAPDLKPVITELVQSGGHSTLRIFFSSSFAKDERLDLLRSLNDLKAYFEQATASYFAIDVEPEGDYRAVLDRLADWKQQGILDYETCEPRAAGSFDDVPAEPEQQDP
jgi:hypothetical protein